MNNVTIRKYNKVTDKKFVQRIWVEIGWLEKNQEELLDDFLDACDTLIAEINGETEFIVSTSKGEIQYLDKQLPFAGVMAVTTSRVARKLGLATKITAKAIAKAVSEGAAVSGLGFFEQGFYNKLGFGTGNYEHFIYFDPADLNINKKNRIPKRITKKDWKKIHFAKLNRKRGHGSVNFFRNELIKAELQWSEKSFGLGYFNKESSTLTHYLWVNVRVGESGPYQIQDIVFQNYDQFLELMALIKSFDDQVRMVKMTEPPNIQMQDFLRKPFRFRQISEKSKLENKMTATAWWQMRICNLEECLTKTHLNCDEFGFNLILIDPIEKYLDADSKWKGITGNYVIKLGSKSSAVKGKDQHLQTLKASVGAFTRMWFGFRPASSLAISDDLSAPKKLLEKLDKAFLLPDAKPDWEF
jgi:predicted acetyltransferase